MRNLVIAKLEISHSASNRRLHAYSLVFAETSTPLFFSCTRLRFRTKKDAMLNLLESVRLDLGGEGFTAIFVSGISVEYFEVEKSSVFLTFLERLEKDRKIAKRKVRKIC